MCRKTFPTIRAALAILLAGCAEQGMEDESVSQERGAATLGGTVLDCANRSGHKRVGLVNGSIQISLAAQP